MEYIFKEKITYSEYDNFLKNYNYLSFMQEEKWARTTECENYLIVGVYAQEKLCAVAQILIKKKEHSIYFYIPNGYLLDFNNKELVAFMTEKLKELAKKCHAYVIDVYPNISMSNSNYQNIHNTLLNNNYKWENTYLDKTSNVLISLCRDNRKITKTELKKRYDKSDFYLKRGLSFEISENLEDIKRLNNLIDDTYYDSNLVGNLLMNFKDRAKLIFAKIDLTFYLNYLKENNGLDNEKSKIDALIQNIGDELDIGCAIIILPLSKKQNIGTFIYNQVKESFENLDIAHGLLYEAIKECNNFGCYYLQISNINLDVDYYVTRFSAIPFNYIGKYSLIVNKISYFLNQDIKKRG